MRWSGRCAMLGRRNCRCFRAGSMDQAVDWARRSASPGDVVLLAPGCTSFDMYRDFEQRGERFRESVSPVARWPRVGGEVNER